MIFAAIGRAARYSSSSECRIYLFGSSSSKFEIRIEMHEDRITCVSLVQPSIYVLQRSNYLDL
jgi:hypothetical protein